MKNLAVLILLIVFSLTAIAQTPRRKKSRIPRKPISTVKTIGSEKEEFDKAVAVAEAVERIAALQKFNENFPQSEERIRASEMIVSGRAALADEKLKAGDKASSFELFRLAVQESPKPVSDKLFNEVVLQIPTNLFFRGERITAVEIARAVEEKAEGNAKQILGLAAFYLNLENASEAKRLAEKAIELDPALPNAYQTLGLAFRLNFQLEDAAAAYQKASELDENSAIPKRNLAEMKRAVGKPLEAVALYREILAKDETDSAAQTGLILALFDAERVSEAESEMQKSLGQKPNNLFLLTGAAYWYAAHEQGAKAIDLAEKAGAVEPRYTWAHIALARALILQKRFPDAEKALLVAKQYGNFPTLDYEIAAVRFQSGFFREAAEGLQKNFTVKDGLIETKLGGRVLKDAKNFIELLSLERRASIFEPTAANNAEIGEQLKSLLDFYQKLESSPNDETLVAQAADEFIKGADKMKLHRQLFVAERLLEKKANPPKVLELTKAVIGNVDTALSVNNPAAAVLADELYESRQLAISRGELIIVPDVSRQTLSNILRGRIENLSGWALFQENKSADAVIRLKRAVSILPEKSSWWRNSMWRLGSALEADGKSDDALDAYIKGYSGNQATAENYAVVESLYQKVKGNTDGLEVQIGTKPASLVSNAPVQTETKVAQTTEKEIPAVEPTPAAKIEPELTPSVTEIPKSEGEVKSSPEVLTNQPELPKVEPTPDVKISEPEPTPEIKTPEAAPTPEAKTPAIAPIEIKSETTPEPKPIEVKTPEPPKTQVSDSSKSLFEPIIISVPKPVIKSSEIVGEKKSNAENRPRRAVEKEPAPIPPCKILSSEESVSVLNGGGSLGMLVSLEGAGDVKEIKFASSSPVDVEVVLQPSIDEDLQRGEFFIVKSVSRKTGEFTVTFELACGKKEVLVKVR